MALNVTSPICGLPGWIGIARNDTVAYINDIVLAVVNVFFATFAFLSNLAIIVAIIKTPSLQKPCNILLCSLASADCLTGITAQPMFVAWRFFLQRAQRSCLHQRLMFDVYFTVNLFAVGLALSIIVIISFDRHYALSRPLVYRTNATKRGTMRTSILNSIFWLLLTLLVKFILPSLAGYIALLCFGVWCIVVPIVNYIRMLFIIRHHNRQMGDAVGAHQISAILQREKRMAIDMCVVAIILLSSVMPGLSIKFFERRYPRAHAIALPWCLTVPFMTSSINPVLYLMRNPNLRNAVKSMINN